MKHIIASIFCAIVLVGCAKVGPEVGGSIVVRFTAGYSNAPAAEVLDAEKVEAINAYLCSDGVVKKVFVLDAVSDLVIEEQYHFASSTLYVVANPASCRELADIATGSGESELEGLSIVGDIDKVVTTGVVDLSGKAGQSVSVQLERAVARFDLVVEQNRGIEVEAVVFDGMPSGGKLFGQSADYINRISYRRDAKTTVDIDGLTYSYPLPKSAGGATASLDVRYNGNLATLVVPLDEIKRNYAYNLNVYAYNGKVSATLNATSMEEGDTTTGVVGYQHTIINEGTTTLCDKATIISPTMVRMPNATCQLTLGLTGDYDKTFTVEGDANQFTVMPVDGGAYQSNQITINVERNKAYGHGGRAAILCVSHVERGVTVTDRISLTQTPPEPFEPVVMGGLEWMPFNALGKDLTLYPIVPAGQSVRDVLKANWYKYGEACYQWGPRKSYNTVSPFYAWWVQGSAFNNVNGPITAMPAGNIWQGESVPCPEGWRLPTYEECERIWAPNGTELPQTYTKKGVEYTMSLEESGLTVGLPVHGNRKLYNVVISNGTTELIFPAGGVRYENNVDHDGAINGFAAKVGSAFALRTQKAANNSGHNAGVGYAVQTQNINTPSKVVLTAGTHSITVGQTYCYIRCVRDILK